MLPKDERLAKASDIRSTTRGNRNNTTLLSIFTCTNQTGKQRIVVICKKELGGAVKRNATRRALIAAYSNNRHKIAKNMDIVIIPKVPIAGLKAAEAAILDGMKIDHN